MYMYGLSPQRALSGGCRLIPCSPPLIVSFQLVVPRVRLSIRIRARARLETSIMLPAHPEPNPKPKLNPKPNPNPNLYNATGACMTDY